MITEFSKYTGISVEDILGKSREVHICDARHVYWYLLYRNGFTITQIAKNHNTVHSTVYYAIRRIGRMKELDKRIGQLYEQTKNIKIMNKNEGDKTVSCESIDMMQIQEVHYNHKLKKIVVIMKHGKTIVRNGDEATNLFGQLSNG
jgi:predicted DNA-binding protein YlxM (UPF0122 family)